MAGLQGNDKRLSTAATRGSGAPGLRKNAERFEAPKPPSEPTPRGGWRRSLKRKMLLDRIAAMGELRRGGYELSATEDMESLMDSVRGNLARLLNARHGFSEAMPDYGLPALTDLSLSADDYVCSVQDAIRVAIEKYEPRLRRVRVTRIAEEEARQTLSFRIDATLVGRAGQHRVYYETTMKGNREFDVSE